MNEGLAAIGHFAWQAAVDELSFALRGAAVSQRRATSGLNAWFCYRSVMRFGMAALVVASRWELVMSPVPAPAICMLPRSRLSWKMPTSLARASLGVAGHCPKTTAGDLAGLYLLERALAARQPQENEWTARLLGRLALYHRVLGAVEGRPQPGGSEEEIEEMSQRSVTISEQLGDEQLHGLMLLWRNLSLFGIDHLEKRLEIANQVVSVAHRHSDYELLAWAIQAHHEYAVGLGYMPSAVASMAQLEWISEHLRMPYFLWLARVQQGGLAFGRGDLESAESHQSVADNTWPRSGCANWLLFAIRREQVRLPEIADRLNFIGARLITSPFQDAHRLLYLAENGKSDDALRLLQQRPVEGYTRISKTYEWLPTVLHLTDAVLALDRREDMPHLFEMLEPYADLDGYSPQVRYPTGAVAGFLGRLAMRLGRGDEAEKWLRHALTLNRERELLLHELWTEVYLSELRLRSATAGDVTSSRLQQIRNQSEERGLTRLQRKAFQLLNDL